jgi:hypothetical protein
VKYGIMMFGSSADVMENRSRNWILEMIDFMSTRNADLTKSDELAWPGAGR